MKNQILHIPRDGGLDSFVRASCCIGSLHNAVEELILNSIDSGATEICVELKLFHNNGGPALIVVSDNGHGIEYSYLRDNVAEWNRTSKSPTNCGKYGFKGEALSAIRALSSTVQIITRPRNSHYTFSKTIVDVNGASQSRQDVRVRKFIDENCERFGTTVSVDGLFYNLAVRLKALRSDVEMNHVKEFMQRMSVLHHSIQMTLIDTFRKKTVFSVKSQSSVSKRFISLHGLKLYLQLQVSASIVLINCPPIHFTVLQEVRMTVGSYTIGGLLSPPVNECCHWTKDFQYMYLNSRWLRNTDIVSSLIDRLYRRTLTSKIAGGPTSKHHSPTKPQNSTHPCFVLQIQCSTAEYDILSEPDKSVAVFKDTSSIYQCIFQLLEPLFLEHQQNLSLFTAEFTRLCGSESLMDCVNMTAAAATSLAINSESVNDFTDNQPTFPKAEHYAIITSPKRKSQPITTLDDSQTDYSPTDSSTAFRDAFYSCSPSPLRPAGHSEPHIGVVFADSGLSRLAKRTNPTVAANNSHDSHIGLNHDMKPCFVKRNEPPQVNQRNAFSQYAFNFADDDWDDDSCFGDCDDDSNGDVVIGAAVSRKRSPDIDGALFSENSSQLKRSRNCDGDYDALSANCHWQLLNSSDLNVSDDDSTDSGNNTHECSYDIASRDFLMNQSDSYFSSANSIAIDPRTVTYYGSNNENDNKNDDNVDNLRVQTEDRIPPVNLSNTIFASEIEHPNVTGAQPSEFSPLKVQVPHDSSSIRHNNLNEDFIQPTSSSATNGSMTAMKCKTIKLYKDILQQFSTVAQWDKKFVLATFPNMKAANPNSRLLLLFDQHALDERLNFENYEARVASSSPLVSKTFISSEVSSILVTEEDMQFIQQTSSLLSLWHFHFSAIPTDNHNDSTHSSSHFNTYTVTLKESPQILGETLTVNDFMEFVYYLRTQSHLLPISAIKPPALKRIIASRSCHASVKFGDLLSRSYCADMLRRLRLTSFPFQCAHGRPSAVPLIEFVDESRLKRRRRKPNYLNIFKELSTLGLS